MWHACSASALALFVSGLVAPAPAPVHAWPARPIPQTSAADLNGDGLSDTVTVSHGRVRVHLSNHAHVRLGGSRHIVGLAVADIDRDGDRDLVAMSSRGVLHIWRNDGRGHFSRQSFEPARSQRTTFRSSSGVVVSDHSTADFASEDLPGPPPFILTRLVTLPALIRGGHGVPPLVDAYRPLLVQPDSSRGPPARAGA